MATMMGADGRRIRLRERFAKSKGTLQHDLGVAETQLVQTTDELAKVKAELAKATAIGANLLKILHTRRHRFASYFGRLFGFQPEVPRGLFQRKEQQS